jgi:hypothetical protein
MEKGDVLVCRKTYCRYVLYNRSWSRNISDKSYIIMAIKESVNVYVSNESGGSMLFSLYDDGKLPYLGDYFVSLVDFREEKLQQLGLL